MSNFEYPTMSMNSPISNSTSEEGSDGMRLYYFKSRRLTSRFQVEAFDFTTCDLVNVAPFQFGEKVHWSNRRCR
jgi:hypothetical protein